MDNSRYLIEFGQRVERARMRLVGIAGWKVGQQHIADAMGVAQSTYGRWENGIKEPAMETVVRLAALLGVTPEWLAFGRGEMASAEPAGFLAAQEGAETTTPPQSEAADDTGQTRTPIKRITVQGQRVDMGRGGRGKRTG